MKGWDGRERVTPAKRGTGLNVALAALLAAALLAAACGCGGGGGGGQADSIRVGHLRDDLHQLAYYVAKEKGYFEAEGLTIEEGGTFNAGPEEMSAFSAGDLDIGYVGAAPAVTFAGQGMADVRIVAQVNALGSALVVRAGMEAEDAASLRGRNVAVPGYSTVQDFLLRLSLEEAGVEAEDVNIITLKPPEMITALETGQIDGFLAWEPYPAMAVEKGVGRVALRSGEIWPDHPCCVLIADTGFADRNPETVRRFVAAHARATEYINGHPMEAADMGHLFTGQESAVVEKAIENIAFVYEPDVEGLALYVDFLDRAGVIDVGDAEAFSNELVDLRFLPEGVVVP